MRENAHVLPLLETFNESQENDKQLGISYLDRKDLHAIRASLVVLLIEADDFNTKNPTNTIAIHIHYFFSFGDKLLQKFYDLHFNFNKLLNQVFFGS